ncbi:MAG TPA: bifunctional UDP-N-acetylglucosamine diphosphorylase/glucosamine-1-phosphate N-acetyltransferase GlmU, partial [Terriglobales bacterium]|nr:bifunctional UDP-N-acetylglucosamine diphosphorylase/glucosamine-1-phosphate N-acetyltransferase GlmU [Terriglobales bacterium]
MPKSKRTRKVSVGKFAIAIMAAGKGTRLKSRFPKVLHEVGGKPMLEHVIASAKKVVAAEDIYVIIGHEADLVRERVGATGVNFVLQAEQRGTGHAIMVARDALAKYDRFLVLSGDVPLIWAGTIERLRDFHRAQKAAMTILTAEVENPHGYGRVVRKNEKGAEVAAIVEQKALTPKQRKLREINSGIYAFESKPLFARIHKLKTDNAHKEYYLTDMARLLVRDKQKVVALPAMNAEEVLGSNTRLELSMIDQHLRMAKCYQLMAEGVTIYKPETCVIDSDVEIAPDTVIEPFVQVLGASKIGGECRIRSYTIIENCEIGDRVEIRANCVLDQARVEPGALIGPFSRLRPGSDIGAGAHVGNFVETKKTRMGRGSKANHLTYLGDALIGDEVNVGAGTITCNFDGKDKHATVIDDGAFIGSDSTLVAPVRIGRGAYVGAGSTITDDVPAESLALGRGRQVVKEGWVRERREKSA